MIKYFKIGAVVVFSLIATWLLFVFMKNPLFDITIFDKDILNFYMGYELSTIIVSLSFMLVIYLFADKIRLSYFNLKKIDGVVKPAPLVGIKPKEGEGWKTIGLSIEIINLEVYMCLKLKKDLISSI